MEFTGIGIKPWLYDYFEVAIRINVCNRWGRVYVWIPVAVAYLLRPSIYQGAVIVPGIDLAIIGAYHYFRISVAVQVAQCWGGIYTTPYLLGPANHRAIYNPVNRKAPIGDCVVRFQGYLYRVPIN